MRALEAMEINIEETKLIFEHIVEYYEDKRRLSENDKEFIAELMNKVVNKVGEDIKIINDATWKYELPIWPIVEPKNILAVYKDDYVDDYTIEFIFNSEKYETYFPEFYFDIENLPKRIEDTFIKIIDELEQEIKINKENITKIKNIIENKYGRK